jgi:eukaryotic-like serine/threonine-protein kinase
MYWALSGRKLPTLFNLKKTDNSFLVDDQMASPRDINPTVPETLSNFVMECVRTSPSKRPQDMVDVTRQLEIIEHTLQRKAATPSHMPNEYRGDGATMHIAR